MTKKTTNAATSQNEKTIRQDSPETVGVTVATVAGTLATPGTRAEATRESESKKGDALQIVTRFPADLGARLDQYTESLRNERFGLRVSRADAVRILVHEALAAHEAERQSPATFSHKGKTFRRTGKVGSSRATGLPSAEYAGEDGSRVWRDVNGTVRDE
jgi:hypothetical protein